MEEEKKVRQDEQTTIDERDHVEELLAIIRSDKPNEAVRDELKNYHDNDIADVIPLLSPQERKKLYKILGNEAVSDIFAYLDNVDEYLAELDNERAADIIESMDADDAVDVLGELDEDRKNELLPLIEPEAQKDIELINSYSDDEIGSRMTTNFISVKKTYTVKQAMRSVIAQAADNDNITTIYAVNEDDTFYGAIELRDLVIAREKTPLDEIITTSYPFLYAHETTEECIESLKAYSEDSIPVLSKDNKILGVITASDVVEAVDEALGEDYAKFAGLTEEEDLDEPLFKSIKKRLPWLVILLALGMLVATVIQLFQGEIAKISNLIVLFGFQSLILDMCGNCGTQSLAVTIRVLSDTELTGKNRFKFIRKELRVGFTNGLIVGLIAFVFAGLYCDFVLKYGGYGFAISGCIGVSLLLSMVIASLIATLIPMFFHKIGIDPAVASGPLITTVNDFVAVCVYYGTAILLLVDLFKKLGL